MSFIILYSPKHKLHKPPVYHPENPERLEAIIKKLKSKIDSLKEVTIKEPELLNEDILLLVHSKDYVKFIKEICKRKEYYWIDSDTYIVKETFNVALLTVSACINGIDLICKKSKNIVFVLMRPPGHHAGSSGAIFTNSQGFCIFNNVAIATRYALNRKFAKRVCIVDLDAHHGNGTQGIFNKSPNVLYISVHQHPSTIYPGTGYPEENGEDEGEGLKVNLPLLPYASDDLYITYVDEIIIPIIEQFKPELTLFSMGFDAHKKDPLTELMLSTNGYVLAYYKIIKEALKYSKGILLAFEGGYSQVLPIIFIKLLNVLRGVVEIDEQNLKQSNENVQSEQRKIFNEVKNLLRRYWSL